MKIIHVTWQAWQYGIETFLLNLLPYQKENYGTSIADIVFHETNEFGEKNYQKAGIKYYSLGISKAWYPSLFFKFKKLFKNYDIVNLHTYSPWAFLAAKHQGKKIVYTFHGVAGIKGQWSDFITKIFHKHIMANYCHYYTFASNSSFKRYLRDTGINKLDSSKYTIFPYGIRIDSVKAHKTKSVIKSLHSWNDRFIIGTAARLDPNKRLEYLIHSFCNLETKEKYLLVFAGSGDEKYEIYLRNLVHKYQLDSYVLFLGYCSNIYDIINVFDVFILPTKEEPFGLALIEAMTLGVPCIVFKDGGGVIDIIGDSGLVVDSVSNLSRIIEILYGNNELQREYSRKAKQRARLFDISFTGKRLYGIYNNLIG